MNQVHTVITASGGIDGLSAKMLDYTLNKNINELEKITIITDLKSKDISDISYKYNLDCIKTDEFYINGSEYARGHVLSKFLKNKNGWILQLDCDIVLPKNFKLIIDNLNLNKNIMYGSRRIMFDKLKQAEKWHETNEYDAEIFCPLGFCYGYFQLFNIESEQIQSSDKDNIYPDSGHIGEHDVWFRNKWGTIIDTNNDPGLFKIFGNLKELPFKVGHLGHSSVNNPLNKDFFN